MRRRWPSVLRGLLAALTLVAVVGGLPLLLVREVGWPLPTVVPSWGDVSRTIATGAIEDATIIRTLAVLVWLAWGNFTAGVLVEAVALARGGMARHVAGLGAAQHLAGNLLATVTLAVTLLARPVPGAAAPVDLRIAVAGATAEQPAGLVGPGHGSRALVIPPADSPGVGVSVDGPTGEGTVSISTYIVQRGDTLWDLGDRLLGDGLRWREIRDLNVGRQQPDGAAMDADTEELHPGWVLRVPGQVAGPDGEGPFDRAVVVERGDTLWDLAEQHLDDPHRWTEIHEENRNEPQPDGDTLRDPDLIRPGWVMDLPDEDAGGPEVVQGTDAHIEPPASDDPAAEPVARESLVDDDREAVDVAPAPDPDTDMAGGHAARSPDEVVPAGAAPSGPAPAEQAGSSAAGETGDIAVVPIVAAGTAAAGLVLTLDRIRRARLRRRQPHHRIPLPTGSAARAEQRLRTTADPDADRVLNLVLRELSGHHPANRPGPPVVLVSRGADGVAVHLDTPGAPPDGWEPRDEGAVWWRPVPADLDELDVHLGTPSRFPALVTVGTMPNGRVGLLDLAHAGCLHLEGNAHAVDTLLAAWSLELATTARADALDVITVGIDGLPQGLERLIALSGPDELREILTHPHPNGPANLPGTVVLATELPAELGVLLRTTSELRGDFVAVVSGLAPRTGNAVLRFAGDGRAALEPGGLEFELAELGADVVPMTASLIEQALHDPEQLVQLPDDDAPDVIHLDEPAPEPAEGEGAEHVTGHEGPTTEVRVLGPVEIVGNAEPFRTNKTIELIVYLALHRRGTDTDTLLEALWPGQVPRPARLYTEASRARKALGTAPDGSPHLPDAELGRYRLADSVVLDHERFAAAVAVARLDPDHAIDQLRDALSLVRGTPLSATATEYAWATNEVYALAQEVVDAAHDLAQLCIAAERHDDAIWAADRGLLADPLAEILVRDLMEAAAAVGNTARIHAAMTRLRRHVAEDADANDGDDWLHPETAAVFERTASGAETLLRRPSPHGSG